MSHAHGHGQGHDARWQHVQIKQQRVEQEREGSEELEDDATYDASFAAGAPAGAEPRHEDEQVRDEPDDAEAGGSTRPDSLDEEEASAGHTWARRTLLRSRAPVVVVRLRAVGGRVEPVPTLPASERSRPMLANLCDFLRDRFGPAGRTAIPDAGDWAKLLGSRPARPAERLALLARLTVTGSHVFDRSSGGSSVGNDLGLGHYLYKFAAFPDGTAFGVRLLLAGGKSGAKGKKSAAEDGPTFERLPVGLRLLALAAALRRERADDWVRDDELFGVLLREEAAKLLGGVSLPAVPKTAVRRFRDWLKDNGRGDLFPKASDRKKSAGSGP